MHGNEKRGAKDLFRRFSVDCSQMTQRLNFTTIVDICRNMPSIENSLNCSVLANPPLVSVSNEGHKTDRKVNKSADGYGSQFPYKLHRLLDDAKCLGFEDVVAWTSDGRAFQIFDKKKLETLILPHYFSSGRFKTVRTTSLHSDCSVFSLLIVLSTVPTVVKSMEFSSGTFAG